MVVHVIELNSLDFSGQVSELCSPKIIWAGTGSYQKDFAFIIYIVNGYIDYCSLTFPFCGLF